jgi:hypothetical protein
MYSRDFIFFTIIMITNTDLLQIAKEYNIPVRAVFAKDKPPKRIYNGGYIINLQDSSLHQGGSHWVALYVSSKNKVVAYMDSFGFVPSQSTMNWLKATGLRNYNVVYNDKQIQNIHSGGCGIYSLFFIDFVSRYNVSQSMKLIMNAFKNLWSDNTEENLRRLKQYIPYYRNS